MGEHIMVDGRELNLFDLPPRSTAEYTRRGGVPICMDRSRSRA